MKVNKAGIIFFVFLFFLSAVSVFSQSRIPPDTNNWFQNAATTGQGDPDTINVIFFEVPDSISSTLYFGVRDPDTNTTSPDDSTGVTSFYLIGGGGALSDANSQLRDYSGDKTLARTGTILSTFYSDTNPVYGDDSWRYFPQGVAPSQGEHIGNKYYFKVVVEVTPREETSVQCEADVAGNLGGDFFRISTVTTDYYVWYDVDNGSADPAGANPGRTGIEVDISLNDPATDVASATMDALNTVNGGTDFDARILGTFFPDSQTVKVINLETGNVADATAGTSAFTVSSTYSTNYKNAYQLDISFDGTQDSTPSEVSGVKSFSYDWTIVLRGDGDDLDPAGQIQRDWNLYPYVPESAAGNMTVHTWDFDGQESGTIDNKSGTQVEDGTNFPVSGNGAEATYDYAVTGETGGTWQVIVTETDDTGGVTQNTAAVWMDNAGTLYRTYSSAFPTTPPVPDQVVLTYEDGTAVADAADTEKISLQIVDSAGDQANYSRTVRIAVSDDDGNLTDIVDTNNGTGVIDTGDESDEALITTDDWGYGWLEIERADNGDADSDDSFIATVTVYWDGSAGVDVGSGDFFGTSTNDSIDVTFIENPDPTISSAANKSFAVGDAATDIPLITIGHPSLASDPKITDNGVGQNELQIRIPTELDAEFNTGVTVPSFGGTASGNVGGTVSYSTDNKTLYIEVSSDFTTGDTLTIDDLQLQNFDSASGGSLEFSWDSGDTFSASDDKYFSISDPNLDYIWTGATDTGWGTTTNWSPNGTPGAGDSILIPSADNHPILISAREVTDLTIGSGGILDLSGQNFTVSGSFENGGSLLLEGTETVSLTNDTNSGTVEYDGAAGAGTLVVGDDYYNLSFSGGGAPSTWVIDAALTVNGDLSIAANNELDIAGYDLTVTGTFSNEGTLLLEGTETVALTNDTNSGTVEYDGAAGGTVGITGFYNLTINGTGIFVLSGAKDVNGALSVASGTLDVTTNDYQLNIGGDADFTGGFTARGGTVELDGTAGAALTTGGQTFNNLAVSNGTGPETISVSGALDINGTLNVASGHTLAVGDNVLTVDGTTTNGGTITLGTASATFTGAVTNTGGTLTGGDGTLTLTGGLSGGALTGSTTTTNVGGNLTLGTFTGNGGELVITGTVQLSSNSQELYDLRIAAGNELIPQDALVVNRHVTIENTGVYTNNVQPLTLGGTGGADGNIDDQNGGTQDLGAVTVNTAAKTMQSAVSMSSLDLDSTLNTGSNNLTISGDLDASGTLDGGSGGTISVGGDITLDTLANMVGTTVDLNGGVSQTVTPNGQTFDTLRAISSSTVLLTGTLTTGDVTVELGSTMRLDSSVYTAAVTLNVSAGSTVTNNGSFELDSSSGALTLAGTAASANYSGNDITWDGNDLTIGDFIYGPATNLANGTDVTLNSDVTFTNGVTAVAGSGIAVGTHTLTLQADSTFAGTVTVGAAGSIAAGTNSLENTGTVTFSGGGSTVGSGDFTSSGTITNTGTNTITASGDVAISGTFSTPLNSTVEMSGAATTINTGVQIGYLSTMGGTATVTATGNALNLAGDLTVGTGTSLDLAALGATIAGSAGGTGTGALDGGSGTVDIGGDFTVPDYTATSATTTIAGTTVSFGTLDTSGGGTVELDGTAGAALTTGGQSFNNLAVSTGAGPETISVSGALDINGTLNVASGHTLAVGDNVLTVDGATTNGGTITLGTASATFTAAVTNTGGTLTGGDGTLTLTGGLSGGALTGSTTTTNVGGNLTLGTFTGNGGELVITGTVQLSSNSQELYDLRIAAGNELIPQDALVVNRHVTIENTGVYTNNVQPLTLGGTGGADGNIDDQNGGTQDLGAVTVNTADKWLQDDVLMSGLTINSGGGLVIAAHSADINGNLTVASTLANTNAGGDVYVAGDVDFTGGTYNKGGLIHFDSGGVQLLTSDTTDVGNIQTSTAGTDLQLQDAGDFDAVTVDANTTLTTGALAISTTDLIANGTLDATGQSTAETAAITGNVTIGAAGSVEFGDGDADIDGSVTGTGSFTASTGTTNIGGATVTFGSFANNGGEVIFDSGGATALTSGGAYNDVTVAAGTTVTMQNAITVSAGAVLVLNAADSVLDAQNNTFDIDTLRFNNMDAMFRLTGEQGAVGQVINNISCNGTALDTLTDDPAGALGYIEYYDGAADGNIYLSEFPNLQIAGTAVNTFTIQPSGTTIDIYANLEIDGGELNGDNATIRLQQDFDSSGGGTFTHNTSTVQLFGSNDSSVLGTNTFYNFVCDVNIEGTVVNGGVGKILYFAGGATQSIAATGGTFSIRGNQTGNIPSTPAEQAETWGPPSYNTSYITMAPANPGINWILNIPAGANLDMQYVDVFESTADPGLNVPADTVIHPNCVDWFQYIDILDSYTRDTDGNGKIDIIEVVTPVNIDDVFTNVEVYVEGYTVADITTGTTANDRVFWIELVEKPYLDTGAQPQWYLVDEGDLRDDAIGSYVLHHPASNPPPLTPWDDADPVVGYTLTVAGGQPEVFVHFSEKVYDSTGAAIDIGDVSYSGAPAVNVDSVSEVSGDGTGYKEVLLTMSGAIPIADVLSPETIDFAGVNDNAPDPPAVNPVWGDLPTGDNPLQRTPHRISDLGLGIIQPVYAMNTETQRDGINEPDIGRIMDFDGSDWLQSQEFSIESNVAGTGGDAQLYFNSRVASSYISGDNPGLWLPIFDEADFSGIVPFPLTSGVVNQADEDTDANIAAHTIASSNPEIIDDSSFDFFYLYPTASSPPLYHGRCTNSAAGNWYRLIRPWSFDIHTLRMQTSKVSVLNNVIDPRNGEVVDIHYVLDKGGRVTVQVFNLAGDLIDVLERSRKTTGEYALSWNGRNQAGHIVARGIYFIRVTGPDIDEIRKVMVVK